MIINALCVNMCTCTCLCMECMCICSCVCTQGVCFSVYICMYVNISFHVFTYECEDEIAFSITSKLFLLNLPALKILLNIDCFIWYGLSMISSTLPLSISSSFPSHLNPHLYLVIDGFSPNLDLVDSGRPSTYQSSEILWSLPAQH